MVDATGRRELRRSRLPARASSLRCACSAGTDGQRAPRHWIDLHQPRTCPLITLLKSDPPSQPGRRQPVDGRPPPAVTTPVS
ncbi:hypothetical protein [Kitasatospora sp. NBC_01300]|uniref:hypothetical protein n=1 Tax=Kitasatospora sp. NBC_01300 TaxID=2903574 RepID=UPI00352ED3C5